MFGIGFSEIVIIALVVIVFVRPDDLPAFIRKAGKFYGQAKKTYGEIVSFKDEFMREMDVAAALKESETPKPQAENKKSEEKAAGEAMQPPRPDAAPASDESPDEALLKVQE
jgi:sec-independent protein translocase protein TatB